MNATIDRKATSTATTGYTEYVENLLAFQTTAAKTVMGEDSGYARMDDILYQIKALARKKNLSYDPTVRECILGLEKINKQIRISASGKNSEDRIAHALSFVQRKDVCTFRNVFVSNGEQETELDNVVVTDSGILILEIKGTKTDITISETGRIIRGSDECYDNTPMAEKMEIKRSLLTQKIKAAMQENGLDMPVLIDTYLVFSAPKSLQYYITDHYHQVKYCRSGKIQFIVNDFESDVHYTEEQMEVLKEIVSKLPACQKRFDSELNMDQAMNQLTAAMAVLNADSTDDNCTVAEEERDARKEKQTLHKQTVMENAIRLQDAKKAKCARALRIAGMVAGFVTVPVAGAAVFFTSELASAIMKRA